MKITNFEVTGRSALAVAIILYILVAFAEIGDILATPVKDMTIGNVAGLIVLAAILFK